MTRLHHDERGVALVTALLAVIILAGLATVFTNRAIVETRASSASQRFESTIHTAEAAADVQIAAMNRDPLHATELGALGRVELDAEQVADPGWLRDLVADEANLSAVRGSEAYVEDDQGEALAIRPWNVAEDEPWDVILAVAGTPSFDAGTITVRSLRLQLDRDRYRPDYALLSDGPISFGGSGRIYHPDCTDPGGDPDACIADVHTNEDIDISGNNARIDGRITTVSGSCSGLGSNAVGCQGAEDGVARQPVPPFTARQLYNRGLDDLNPDAGGHEIGAFDLCPDGRVRQPTGSTPCTGTVIWPQSGDASTFRGWEWRSGQHSWRANSLQGGVFYVYDADAEIRGTEGSDARSVTVLVEGTDSRPTSSGSLQVSGNPRLRAGLSGVLFVTDRDLALSGTSGGGPGGGNVCQADLRFSGFVGVGEQLTVTGNARLFGSMVVRDLEDRHGLVRRNNASIGGNMCLEYDDDLVVDLGTAWVVTFWNER